MSSWYFLWDICDLRNPHGFLKVKYIACLFFLVHQLCFFGGCHLSPSPHHALRLFALCGWVGWSHGGLHCRVEGPLGAAWQLHWLDPWWFGTGEPNCFLRGMDTYNCSLFMVFMCLLLYMFYIFAECFWLLSCFFRYIYHYYTFIFAYYLHCSDCFFSSLLLYTIIRLFVV